MATDDKISGMIFPADDKAKVSSNDSQTGFLATKLVAGANVTITENNNGANETLTIAAAGGVTGFTGSVNTAAPNNTVNASRLLVDVPTTNGDLVLQPKQQGAITAQLPDASTGGGNKRGLFALDLQLGPKAAAGNVASGVASTILGGQANTGSAAYACIIGGNANTVNGQYGAILSSQSSTVNTGSNGVIIGGSNNGIGFSNTHSVVLGGTGNYPNDNQSYQAIIAGQSCQTGANYAVVLGGSTNVNNAINSAILCGAENRNNNGVYGVLSGFYALGSRYGERVHASGRFTALGDCQHEQVILRVQTVGAVTNQLLADGTVDSADRRISIATDSTYTFTGIVTARRASTANESAGWEIKGIIQNSGGTTAFVGTPTVTLLGASAGASTWVIAITANDTLDHLRIDATGETGKTIRWGAYVNLMKVAG